MICNPIRFLVFLCVAVSLSASRATADEASLVPFQGHLTKPSSDNADEYEPVPNGRYTVVFSFYSTPPGSNRVWGPEQHKDVVVINGLVNVLIGSVKNLPKEPDFFSKPLYVGIAIGDESNPDVANLELLPRQVLLPVMYAQAAGYATHAATAKNAKEAEHAAKADHATNADNAASATNAVSANSIISPDGQRKLTFADIDTKLQSLTGSVAWMNKALQIKNFRRFEDATGFFIDIPRQVQLVEIIGELNVDAGATANVISGKFKVSGHAQSFLTMSGGPFEQIVSLTGNVSGTQLTLKGRSGNDNHEFSLSHSTNENSLSGTWKFNNISRPVTLRVYP